MAIMVSGSAAAGNWPTWRGPNGDGIAEGNPPVSWSETENVKWKVKLPGKGHSTPVVWGDQMFFLTAVPTKEEPQAQQQAQESGREGRGNREGGGGRPPGVPENYENMSEEERQAFWNKLRQERASRREQDNRNGGAAQAQQGDREQRGERRRRGGRGGGSRGSKPTVPYKFKVVCLDRTTGGVVWEKTAKEAVPHEGAHRTGTQSSYSPITDGKLLWASFGSRGLHCYDLDGNHKWSRDLIQMQIRNSFGEGSSPALVDDAIVVVADHEGQSKIFAFNKDSGEPLWVTDRNEPTTWATPFPVKVGDAMQVVVPSSEWSRCYDVASGEELWRVTGLTSNVIATPVAGFGNVYVMSGHRGYALQAIELGHSGDLTGSEAIKWKLDKNTPYIASPLLYDDKLYLLEGRSAVLSCYDAESGKPVYEAKELSGMGTVYASPVGAQGRLYISDREGNTAVVKHGDTYELVAQNKLDDVIDASPVVIGETMYMKGNTHLYCIAES
jgi:outer membrane protein assembly factor BamB